MLRQVEIENFRGFRHLTVSDLSRVNLIAGQNNAGKTALLEALFLMLSPMQPQLATSFHHRGESGGTVALAPHLRYADEWRTLFFGLDTANLIRLQAVETDEKRARLDISVRTPAVQVIDPPLHRGPQGVEESTGSISPEAPLELLYDYWSADEDEGIATATPSSIGTPTLPRERLTVTRSGAVPPSQRPTVFLATGPQQRARIAEEFSKARDRGYSHSVEAVVRKLDSRIRNLEIRVAAQRPEMAADVGVGALVPLRMMGEGVARVVEIVLSIFNETGGVVLIDEIENGIHYSVMSEVWSAVMEAARRADVQVFATTHSFECIRAAHLAAVSSAPDYELRLHRLDRVRGEVLATTMDRDSIATAVDMGIEVR